MVHWLYKHDATLKLPYQDNLSALIHEPTFKASGRAGGFCQDETRSKTSAIWRFTVTNTSSDSDALAAVRELFHVGYWLAHTYARGAKPPPGLAFDPNALPKTTPLPKQTLSSCNGWKRNCMSATKSCRRLLADKTTLDAELKRLRAKLPRRRRPTRRRPTRTIIPKPRRAITSSTCCSKKRAGRWTRNATGSFPWRECRTTKAKGFVDYVLWGDDGMPLALVEAKRTKRDPRVGQQQAKLYADCLEKQFGRRPIIFYSNGYEHWIWDDTNYPPRPVQGFYKKAELELLIQRRTTRKTLADAKINDAIVERYYQTRGVRRIGEAFENDNDRKTLLVHGHRRGQDAHGHRAVRSADALQLGEARAVPGRPGGAGESGRERLQTTSARCVAGESGHREGHRGSGVRFHLPDDDGLD